jgi:excinuclease ABC subunit C
VEVRVLHVREGRVVGSRAYDFSDVRLDDGAVMSSFLSQYYAPGVGRDVPSEVLTPVPAEDAEALADAFSQQAGRKVSVRAPQRGHSAELVATATANAELGLAQRLDARESLHAALEELREELRLAAAPRRIECYDVSTLHGTLTVASRVVFEDGQPNKHDYRRYRIRDAAPDDDYACLREVMERRLRRVAKEPLPDLLMVDGGKGQLGVVTAALRDHGLEVACLGIAKERVEDAASPRVRRSGGLKAERLFLPNVKDPVALPASSKGLLLLQRVRDESHRFAIEFQRLLRSKLHLTSILEELPGIGPRKRKALLKQLGSLRAVRAASESQLAEVRGVSARDAATLRRFFAAIGEVAGEGGSGGPDEVAPASEAETGAGSGHSGPL